MIKNYFIIAVRNIIRNKIHSLINILGLAIGLASVILILLFIYHELSYDKFHPDAQNTYRVYAYQPSNRYMNSVYFNVTPALFVPTAKQYFPEIQYASRIWMNGGIMSVDDKHFEQEYFYAVDPDFLKMFSVDVFLGDKENALAEPNSIVISKRISDKYFFGENPIGQQINMDDKTSFRVTAVFNELPSNTHFNFDILIHFDNIKLYRDAKMLNSWSMNSYPAYIQLNENISEEQMEQKLIPFIKQYLDDSTQDRYLLQKISDIHLEGHINFEISSNGDIKYIAIFGIIAILILLIASFNYVNLSTARSFKRAKEVGLRKVMGASRNQLIKQYLGESVFITFISLIMALILIEIFIPYFNEFVDRKLSLYNSGNVIFILIIIVTLAISLLAGSYPAIYLSRFTPIKVIKGIVQGSKKTSNFRNILILMQFAISVSLIICTIVVISQLTYIRNKQLGFETENIITIRLRDSDLIKNLSYLKTSLLQNSGILDVSSSNYLPSSITSQSSYKYSGLDEKTSQIAYFTYVDHNFLDFYNIPILKGENFTQEMEEGTVCLINQEAVKKIEVENPVNSNIEKDWQEISKYRIIGEIENFHFASLHQPIQPAILVFDTKKSKFLSIKLHPDKVEESISFIENQFKSLSPKYPFVYNLIEDTIDRSYHEERRLSKLFNFFTIMAAFIASLGLYGLVSFIIEQRTKEIGIRKVFGASVKNIIYLLSGYFSKWILIANILAYPIAYYYMDKWLSNFAYGIKLNFWIFLSASLVSIFIIVLTTGFLSIKAANANPVESLKYE